MKQSRWNKEGKQHKKKERHISHTTGITTGIATVVIVFFCILGSVLYLDRTHGKDEPSETGEDMQTVSVEFGAERGEENQAVHTMLNKPAAKPEAGDNRTVFKIIEVIPHEACSVFPYLVEWGSPKAYDENVAIGYEGLLSLTAGWEVFMFNEESTAAKDSNPYTIARESIRQAVLNNYEVPMGSDSNPNGKWYRKTQPNKEGLITESGYFEYVGKGNGLYYLSASHVTDNPDGRGVRYETKAVARKGTQSPKGEMYVADAAYYLAKEHQSVARPDYSGKKVVSQTGYHYDLSFREAAAGSYAADLNKIKTSVKPEYAYQLVVESRAVSSWETGYTYAVGGNYAVDSAVQENTGAYVRISDSSRSDGYTQSGLDAGYFRLAVAQDGGAPRYSVLFQEAAAGCYYANPPRAWSGLQTAPYFFTYAGNEKGFYDVAFYYDTDSTVRHYQENLVQIEHDMGRYALTATSKTAAGMPVYEEGNGAGSYPADYTKIIKNISFYDGINWGQEDAQYSSSSGYNAGVGINLGGGDSSLESEAGGFVFVPVSDKKDRKETPLSILPKNTAGKNTNTDDYYKIGDRIYVTGQERRYRYYCRDGFYNNEWFKLLCYSTHPKDSTKPYTQIIDGVGYDYNKTSGENLADPNTKALLEAFNQNMRIEIVQITPEKLTAADVKSAQLIYISNQEGIHNLSGKWNQISDARKKVGLDPLASCNWSGICSKYGDISDEALMTIYDECIWKRNRALIASIDIINSNNMAKTNLEKLGYFMNFFVEARNWAEFMPQQYPDIANEDFSRIKKNTEVSVCKTSYEIRPNNSRTHYNWGYDADRAETHSGWINEYFQVFSKKDGNSIEAGYEHTYYIGWNIGQVLDGETKLTLGYWLPGFLQDIGNSFRIWLLIQNSQEDRSTLAIEVLDAQATASDPPQLVIYGDELDADTFSFAYKVNLLGGGDVKPQLDVTLRWEGGTLLEQNTDASYGKEYEVNTRKGFTQDGTQNGTLGVSSVKKKLIISAENANGKEAEAEVWVVVREGFDLN